MIFVTGDTHGGIDIDKLSSKNFKIGKNIHGDITKFNDDSFKIRIGYFNTFLEIVDTLCHELAHLVQSSNGYKMNHGKKFRKIHKKIFNKWLEITSDELYK